MNVSSGDKLISCAALSSAFINGIKAFAMDHAHTYLCYYQYESSVTVKSYQILK